MRAVEPKVFGSLITLACLLHVSNVAVQSAEVIPGNWIVLLCRSYKPLLRQFPTPRDSHAVTAKKTHGTLCIGVPGLGVRKSETQRSLVITTLHSRAECLEIVFVIHLYLPTTGNRTFNGPGVPHSPNGRSGEIDRSDALVPPGSRSRGRSARPGQA